MAEGILARIAYAAHRAMPGAKTLLPKPALRWVLLHILHVNRDYAAFGDLASRRFLEHEVLPWLAATCARILFVGTSSYTFHYERLFRQDRAQFTTIDCDPSMAVWGADNHIVAPIEEICRHRPPASFDAVVLNGVFGFGVNDTATMRTVAQAVYDILKPGGRLILGWNTDLHADPQTLGVLDRHFQRDEASPWGCRRTFPGEFHVNDFYIRRPL